MSFSNQFARLSAGDSFLENAYSQLGSEAEAQKQAKDFSKKQVAAIQAQARQALAERIGESQVEALVGAGAVAYPYIRRAFEGEDAEDKPGEPEQPSFREREPAEISGEDVPNPAFTTQYDPLLKQRFPGRLVGGGKRAAYEEKIFDTSKIPVRGDPDMFYHMGPRATTKLGPATYKPGEANPTFDDQVEERAADAIFDQPLGPESGLSMFRRNMNSMTKEVELAKQRAERQGVSLLKEPQTRVQEPETLSFEQRIAQSRGQLRAIPKPAPPSQAPAAGPDVTASKVADEPLGPTFAAPEPVGTYVRPGTQLKITKPKRPPPAKAAEPEPEPEPPAPPAVPDVPPAAPRVPPPRPGKRRAARPPPDPDEIPVGPAEKSSFYQEAANMPSESLARFQQKYPQYDQAENIKNVGDLEAAKSALQEHKAAEFTQQAQREPEAPKIKDEPKPPAPKAPAVEQDVEKAVEGAGERTAEESAAAAIPGVGELAIAAVGVGQLISGLVQKHKEKLEQAHEAVQQVPQQLQSIAIDAAPSFDSTFR